MTPEERARQLIDGKLEAAGWVVQDFRAFDPRAGHGIAVREYPTDTGLLARIRAERAARPETKTSRGRKAKAAA